MSITDYIKLNRRWIVSNIIVLILINAIIYSSTTINRSLADLIYMDILIIVIQLTIMVYGFVKERNKYNRVLENIGNTQRLATDKGDFYVDTLLEVVEKESERFHQREESYKFKINDLQEYITQWVHDIKVNIGVCDLLLEEININNENIDKLNSQIERIKFNVNQVLQVTRANHYDQDFRAEKFDIAKEIKSAIRENALFFINKNIEIDTRLDSFALTSDKKWVHYIISQILNNSSKYTPINGQVSILTEEDERAYYLHIKDNGIGIPKEDMKRIFNKGFTGNNGRKNTKSTGMGLYYAKKMADKLSIGIDVRSEEGKYTEFIISFYKIADYYNITEMSH